ncbi:zinc-binding dehydrogenase [Streptomyces sulphureus]|uniref:zinc-binding dehydrogenase n=1 Tax=Streptomyces sulphureus TaxID=47758 RepID=UPI00037E9745|nr:zinc-binding dehydrogenase [Streptomyces sulphureus]
MHAVHLHAFGPAENLVLEQVPDPLPPADHLRVAVEAAGVHLLDAVIRQGRALGPFPLPELPTVPGREVAGTVDAVGPGVDTSLLGRRVVAHLGRAPGGYAELAVVPVESVHFVPEQLSAAQAVAMIGTGRTVMAVLDSVELTAADTVLVLAAAGGMGALLTQYAHHRGARTIAAAGGPEKTDRARSLGADLAVDYNRPDWPETVRTALGTPRPVTHLFDGPGGALARTATTLLAPAAIHHAYGGASTRVSPEADDGTEEAPTEGITVRGLPAAQVQDRKREFEEASLRLATEDVLAPLVHTFPLTEAAAAHRALENRETVGKVVLVP